MNLVYAPDYPVASFRSNGNEETLNASLAGVINGFQIWRPRWNRLSYFDIWTHKWSEPLGLDNLR